MTKGMSQAGNKIMARQCLFFRGENFANLWNMFPKKNILSQIPYFLKKTNSISMLSNSHFSVVVPSRVWTGPNFWRKGESEDDLRGKRRKKTKERERGGRVVYCRIKP